MAVDADRKSTSGIRSTRTVWGAVVARGGCVSTLTVKTQSEISDTTMGYACRDDSGRRFSAETIETCVRWYVTYRLSYRDLVAMMAEQGVVVSHTTIMRWVLRYVPEEGVTTCIAPWIDLERRSHRCSAMIEPK